MSALTEELVEISMEALAKQNIRVTSLEKLSKSLANRELYDPKEYRLDQSKIQDQIIVIGDDVEDRISKAIESLPIPSDGLNGKDGESIKGDIGLPGLNGKDGKSITGKNGKDGATGKAVNGKDGKDGKSIVGKSGPKGTDGLDGKSVDRKELRKLIASEVDNAKYNSLPVGAPVSPGVNSILGSSDVKISNIGNGQTLQYDTSVGKWVNVVTSGITTIDFGAGSTSTTSTVEGISHITSTSVVFCQVRAVPTKDHTVDDILSDPIRVLSMDIQPGVGFTVYGTIGNAEATGTYSVDWFIK